MRYGRTFALCGVTTAIVLFGGAGIAAGETTLCKVNTSPCPVGQGYPVGTEVHLQLVPGTHATTHAGFAEVTCKKSTKEFKIETATTPSGKGSSFKTECSGRVMVLKTGTVTIHHSSGGNGKGTTAGTETTVEQAGVHCVYGGNVTSGISFVGGNPGKVLVNAQVPLVSGGFFCANPAKTTAEYEIVKPKPVFITTGV
jgi:hypothetical protein